VWRSDPLFYPALPPAHWPMVGEVAGRVLVVPLAPTDSGDLTRCRPIGCYDAAVHLANRRRRSKLTEMVPVRFPPETLEQVRRRAGADDRSVSSWIRRAVEHELDQPTG